MERQRFWNFSKSWRRKKIISKTNINRNNIWFYLFKIFNEFHCKFLFKNFKKMYEPQSKYFWICKLIFSWNFRFTLSNIRSLSIIKPPSIINTPPVRWSLWNIRPWPNRKKTEICWIRATNPPANIHACLVDPTRHIRNPTPVSALCASYPPRSRTTRCSESKRKRKCTCLDGSGAGTWNFRFRTPELSHLGTGNWSEDGFRFRVPVCIQFRPNRNFFAHLRNTFMKKFRN